MTAARERVRRPYAFRGRHLTDIDLAEQIERFAELRELREALTGRLGAEVAAQETEAVLTQALDELGEELVAEVASDIDAILRTWSRLADDYRSAADRAEMGRIALELAELPGRLEERVHFVPNAGGMIDAIIPTGLVSRLRYPVAAGRVSPERLADLGSTLRGALGGAISHELLRADALEPLVHRAVQPLLTGLRGQPETGRLRDDEPLDPTGSGWTDLDSAALEEHLEVGPVRLLKLWAPRPAPSADHLPQGIEGIALTPDGKHAVWGPWEPWLHALDEDDQARRLGALDGRAWWRHCLAVAISPDGQRAATGGAAISVWDLGAGRALLDLAESETEELHGLTFSPCGRLLAAVGASSRLQVFDTGTGQALWQAALDEPAHCVAFTADGRQVVAGGWAGSLSVHEADGGGRVAIFDDIGGCINGVAVDPGGRWLATAGGSGCDRGARLNPGEVGLRLWDASSGAVVLDLAGHTHPVAQVRFVGPYLVSIGDDGTLRLWSMPDGNCVAVLDFRHLDDLPTAIDCCMAPGAAPRVLVGTQAGWVIALELQVPA